MRVDVPVNLFYKLKQGLHGRRMSMHTETYKFILDSFTKNVLEAWRTVIASGRERCKLHGIHIYISNSTDPAIIVVDSGSPVGANLESQ